MALLICCSAAYAHYCSCFPGSAGFTNYMCTYSEPKTPLFHEDSQSFKFTMVAEQLRSNVGCPVKDARTDCTEGSGCELDCLFENCGVPISISNFGGEVVKCEMNTGNGWIDCAGNEFNFIFADPDVTSIDVQTDIVGIGSTINEVCGSSPYRINIPVEFIVTDNAIEADYEITVRTTWDPDIYSPCDFKRPDISSSCTGPECGMFLRESYSDFIINIGLKETDNTIQITNCPQGCAEGYVCNEETNECVQEITVRMDPNNEKEGGSFPTWIIIVVIVVVLVVVVLIFLKKKKSSPPPLSNDQFN